MLPNDNDTDRGAVLSLVLVSVVSGKGTATIQDGKVVDPGSAFDSLLPGQSEVVKLTYKIKDRYGATTESTVDVTVHGRVGLAVGFSTTGDNVQKFVNPALAQALAAFAETSGQNIDFNDCRPGARSKTCRARWPARPTSTT